MGIGRKTGGGISAEKGGKIMAKAYITVTGVGFRYGNEFMKKGMKVKLIKEPDNKYDIEAIRVDMKGIGTIGYVANSVKTVLGDCMSAGRLYDRIGKKATATVKFAVPGAVICKVSKRDLK